MFEYIKFGFYAKKFDEKLKELHDYLINKYKQGEYITSDDKHDCIAWYSIYCELTKKWYTTNYIRCFSDEHYEDFFVINDAIATDDKPDFFGNYLIIYDDKLKKSAMILEMPTQYDEEDFTIDGKLEHGKYFCWYRDNNGYQRLHIASELNSDFQWPHDGQFYLNGDIYKEYFYNDTAFLAFKVGDKIYMRDQDCLKFYLMPREPIDDKDAYELYLNNKQ